MIAWGLDPAAAGFAVAAVDVDTGGLLHAARHDVEAPGTDEARVRAVAVLAHRELHALAANHPPDVIGLELPVGKFPVPKLMAGWGALTVAAVGVGGHAVAWMVPTEWRRRAGTNAWKPAGLELIEPMQLAKSHQLNKPTKFSAMAQAYSVGYAGLDVDEADAVCIALGARTLLGS